MPQLKIDELNTALSKQGLAPLYVIHGEETLLALEAADVLRTVARQQGFEEREVLTVEGHFDWSYLFEAAMSVSLFASRKLLELRIPSGKPGIEGAEALQRLAQQLPVDTLVLILLPRLERAQQQSKWFSALEKQGVVLAAQPIDRRELPQWIRRRLAAQQHSMTPEALAFFVDRVEGNLLAARQEIDKLALLYPAGELDLPEVQAAVANVARFDVFALSEAWLAGDTARTLRMLHGLAAEGESPVLVLWSLAEELRTLIRVSDGRQQGRSMNELLREFRVWGARQRWIEPALRRLSRPQLLNALSECARIDRCIKGAEAGEPWGLLQNMLRMLCKS